MRSLFLPTAFAAEGNKTIFTFEVTEAAPLPTGPSSILFLPGIQASRLYTESERVWEPGNNDDVRMLEMTTVGESVHAVHTEDVVEEMTGLAIGGNIYKGFLNFLEDLKEDEESPIQDYSDFAYDWRYDVFDIVRNGTQYEDGKRYLQDVLTNLANNSHSKKVTIVAHSNGGLLAKALLIEHPELSSKVDKIIFIGTPHLGTPKAIGTVLHGYDQEALGGLIIDDVVARNIIKNLPGVYSLLPSTKYLEKSTLPLVFFNNGAAVELLRNTYGVATESPTEFNDFLVGSDGRMLVDGLVMDEAHYPSIANGPMLFAAQAAHEHSFDTWEAPEGIEVTTIVGTGVPTMQSLIYRNVTEKVNGVVGDFLKPMASLSKYGDETVMSLSAEEVDFDKRYYVDLEEYNDSRRFDKKKHANLTEITEIQSLLKNVLSNEQSDIEYVHVSEPTYTEEYSIEMIDSPVAIYATDKKGNRTGLVPVGAGFEIVIEIPGSNYFEFGGTKYLVIPKETDTTTTLVGMEDGSYTLTIATLNEDDEQLVETELVNETVSPGMIAVYKKEDGVYSTLFVDLDNDGQYEKELTLSGEIIYEITSVQDDENTMSSNASGTRVGFRSEPNPQVAGAAINIDTTSLTPAEIIILLESIRNRLLVLQQGL